MHDSVGLFTASLGSPPGPWVALRKEWVRGAVLFMLNMSNHVKKMSFYGT